MQDSILETDAEERPDGAPQVPGSERDSSSDGDDGHGRACRRALSARASSSAPHSSSLRKLMSSLSSSLGRQSQEKKLAGLRAHMTSLPGARSRGLERWKECMRIVLEQKPDYMVACMLLMLQ